MMMMLSMQSCPILGNSMGPVSPNSTFIIIVYGYGYGYRVMVMIIGNTIERTNIQVVAWLMSLLFLIWPIALISRI